MKLPDFIYYFSKNFFQHFVTETICIENWEGKDFDNRYIEYAQLYLKSRDAYQKLTKKEVQNILKFKKEQNLKNFYSKLKSKVLNNIVRLRKKNKITKTELNKFNKEINSEISLDRIGTKFMIKLREFENFLLNSTGGDEYEK